MAAGNRLASLRNIITNDPVLCGRFVSACGQNGMAICKGEWIQFDFSQEEDERAVEEIKKKLPEGLSFAITAAGESFIGILIGRPVCIQHLAN